MILIAHRGNVSGPNCALENNPYYVQAALDAGYEAEVDVWWVDGKFFLGHDRPTFPVAEKFFAERRLWCHAKNLPALEKMLWEGHSNCFWHQNDDFTITSHGFIWTYPGKPLTSSSICLMPEWTEEVPQGCLGVCTDYPKRYVS